LRCEVQSAVELYNPWCHGIGAPNIDGCKIMKMNGCEGASNRLWDCVPLRCMDVESIKRRIFQISHNPTNTFRFLDHL
jgi:hypothetical protein